ncbi:glycosyltransferase family 39 protein [Thiotrichales bacterium 19S11-10]|nr:glycosyltransferase family 39 protein [Thiotrichales bacterium 19S11-10]
MIESKSQQNVALDDKKEPSPWIDVFWLTLAYSIYFLFLLGSRHLSIPDEGRYPEIAREMLTSGNWITPTINGVPFLDKPVLYYWLEATSMYFFGVNSWAIRLPQALFGIIGCLAVYGFGRFLYSRRVALLSSLILAISILYFFAAHYANLDLMVANFLWISFFFFLCSLRFPYSSVKSRGLMYLAYAIAALAFLTKGLMGIIFPMMVVFVWMLITNNWREFKKLYIPTGIVIFLAISMPWIVLVQIENPDFLYFFFYYQQVHRFVGGGFNNQFGPWFYFAILLAAFLPFSLMLLHRVLPGLKSVWINRQGDQTTLLIQLWCILIVIFFSIPSSKIVGYILPVIPPLALLIALSFSRLIQKSVTPKSFRMMHAFAAIIFLVIAIGGLIYPLLQDKFSKVDLYDGFLPASVAALGVFISLFFTFKDQLKKAIMLIVVSMVIFNLSVLTVVPVFDKKTSKPLVDVVYNNVNKQTAIVSYKDYWEDLPLLFNRKIYVVNNWKTGDFKADNWSREFTFGIKQYQKAHHGLWPEFLIDKKAFSTLWFSKQPVIVFMNQSKLREFSYYYTTEDVGIKIYATYRDVVVIGKVIKKQIK